jgi:hypothetical protein
LFHVQVVAACQHHQFAAWQGCRAVAAQRIRQVGLCGVGEKHARRTLDAGDEIADLRFGHADHRRQGQARIAAPGPAAIDHRKAAFHEQARHRFGQCIGLHARADRGVDIGEHAQALARQGAGRGDRVAQACDRAFRCFRQCPQGLDRNQSRHPLWAGRRHEAGDAGAHRVPEQREAFPLQRVGDVEHGVHRAGERIIRTRWQMQAAAMAGQVGGDQLDGGQKRRQWREAGGIVEPAVQGQDLRRVDGARAQAGDAAQRDLETELLHRRRAPHQRASSRCASAASASACAAASLRQGM